MQYIYAALLLHKAGKEISEENLRKVLEAAGTNVDEARLKTVVASLKGIDIEKILQEAPAVPAATVAPTAPKEEKKEEKREEAVEGLAALFG